MSFYYPLLEFYYSNKINRPALSPNVTYYPVLSNAIEEITSSSLIFSSFESPKF